MYNLYHRSGIPELMVGFSEIPTMNLKTSGMNPNEGHDLATRDRTACEIENLNRR